VVEWQGEGMVLRTTPAAGSLVAPGDTIRIQGGAVIRPVGGGR